MVLTGALGVECLVLAPKSVLAGWTREADRWLTPDWKHWLRVDSASKVSRSMAALESYPQLVLPAQGLQGEEVGDSFSGVGIVVLDEAHSLRHKESSMHKNFAACGVPRRLLLTATPVNNNLAELATLLACAVPAAEDLDVARRLIADIEGGRHADFDRSARDMKELQKVTDQYILRREDDCHREELPPKTEQWVFIPLRPDEDQRYRQVLAQPFTGVSAAAFKRMHELPDVLAGRTSSKLEWLRDLIQGMEKQDKVVVVSGWHVGFSAAVCSRTGLERPQNRWLHNSFFEDGEHRLFQHRPNGRCSPWRKW